MKQGTVIKKQGERLVIRYKENILMERHTRDISRILIFGNVQITTQAVSAILKHGIECVYFTAGGYYKGRTTGVRSKSSVTKLAQIKHWKEEDIMHDLAVSTVRLKLYGQLHVLRQRRHAVETKTELKETGEELESFRIEAGQADNPSSLRGIEGSATRTYFSCWDELLPENFPFERRSRRPALNRINSLMNLSYAILLNEINSSLESRGFDPMLGYYHRLRHGRVSLSLDVMEIFRPLLVDKWLLQLVRNKKMSVGDFELEEGSGFMLSEEGRRKYYTELRKWQMKTKYRQRIEEASGVLETCYKKGAADDFEPEMEKVLSHLL
jgi:CRISP-associated protein Cas1